MEDIDAQAGAGRTILFSVIFVCYTLLAIWSLLRFSAPYDMSSRSLKSSQPTSSNRPHIQIPTFNKSLILVEEQNNIATVYKLNSRENKPLFTFNLPRYYYGEKDIFQMSKDGKIAYTTTENSRKTLYVWDGQKSIKRYGSDKGFSFILSPDGKYAVLLTTTETDVNDSYKGFEKTNEWKYTVYNTFLLLSLDSTTEPKLIYEDGLVDNQYDSNTKYEFVGWNGTKGPLLQTYSRGQLSTTITNLYELDIFSKKISKKYPTYDAFLFQQGQLSQKSGRYESRQYLQTSKDNILVSFRNIDPACCGGLNYGNDQTFILNTTTGKISKVFDEYTKYKDISEEQKFTEEHQTENLFFAPNDKIVAQTINHLRDIPNANLGENVGTTRSIIVSDIDGNELTTIDGYTALGWMDDTHILAARTNSWADFRKRKYSSIDIIDITTGDIQSIYSGSFNNVYM